MTTLVTRGGANVTVQDLKSALDELAYGLLSRCEACAPFVKGPAKLPAAGTTGPVRGVNAPTSFMPGDSRRYVWNLS